MAVVAKDQTLLELGRKAPVPEFPAKGYVYLRPSSDLIGTRPKVMEGANLRLFPIRNFSGRIVINHTEEEYEMIRPYVNDDFWQNFVITIPPRGKVYNVESVKDMIELRMLFLYPMISPTRAQMKSTHLFYIENAQAEAQEQNKKAQLKFRAIKALYELTNVQKIEFLTLYEHSTAMATPEIAEAKLYLEIERDPARFLRYIENEEATRNEIDFATAIHHGVIRIVAATGEYIYNKQVLGFNREEALRFFSDIKNQKLKMAIRDETERKKL